MAICAGCTRTFDAESLMAAVFEGSRYLYKDINGTFCCCPDCAEESSKKFRKAIEFEKWHPPHLLTKPSVTHYSHPAGGIEPIDLINSLNLDFFEGNVVKYVCRHRAKNGLDDLRKAKQYLEWLIEREERKNVPQDSN